MAALTTALTVIIALLGIAAVAIFLTVVAATILVTAAVRTEERRWTLSEPAPGPVTRLARRILAVPEPPANRAATLIRRTAPVAPSGVAGTPARAERAALASASARSAPESAAHRPSSGRPDTIGVVART